MDSQVGAKGAQIYAQVAQEKYSSVSEAADALVRVADVFEPDTGDKELHHSRYRRFLALRQAIQPFWHEQ
jgi:ribulose kinase